MSAIRRPKPCPCGAVTLTKSGSKGRGYKSFVHYLRRGVAEVHAVEGCRIISFVKNRAPTFDGRWGTGTREFKIKAIPTTNTLDEEAA